MEKHSQKIQEKIFIIFDITPPSLHYNPNLKNLPMFYQMATANAS